VGVWVCGCKVSRVNVCFTILLFRIITLEGIQYFILRIDEAMDKNKHISNVIQRTRVPLGTRLIQGMECLPSNELKVSDNR